MREEIEMTKEELVTRVAAYSGQTKKTTEDLLKALSVVLSNSVARGEEVSIPDVGKFSRVVRAQREVRNPRTGEKMIIASRWAVHFSPAKSFKEKVGGKTPLTKE